MKLNFNVVGQERKSLVGAISTTLNAPTHYLGAPTFTYEVGVYRIDKNGVLEGEDNLDLEDALHQQGFDANDREYDSSDSYESSLGTLESPKELGIVSTFGDYNTLTVEIPLEGFTSESIENLEKLVASKANLIKKAIGAADLPIERTETTLKFPWFSLGASGEEASSYTLFISAICETAKIHKRVTAKEKDVENEKFAFRVFLIRLGFVGDEYKIARKILLRNLSGNSAFKNAKKESEVIEE